MVDHQLHCMLTTLSHCQTIPDKLLKKGNEHMQEIFLILQKKSKYKLDRCRLLGGVGKKTSIVSKFDYDCVIYVNDVDPPFERLLNEWKHIFNQNLRDVTDEIIAKQFSIEIKIQGLKFDILPAPNYADSNHDTKLQVETIWKIISREENANERQKISYRYGSGLSELALKFLEKQSGFIHDLCRLAKFWNFTVLFEQYVSGRSSIIECLAVKAGQEEEQAAINDELSMLRAFRRFLYRLTKYEEIGVVFFDFYERKLVPINKKPYLIDPSNPYNNYLANISDRFLPTLGECSQETLNRLEKCKTNIHAGFAKLFAPLTDLQKSFTPAMNINPGNIMIGIRQNCDEKSLNLIKRREKFDSATLAIMNGLMTSFSKELSNTFKGMTKEDDGENVVEATRRFVEQSFSKCNDQWTSGTMKHDDFDITFILPLNTTRKHAVYISMTK